MADRDLLAPDFEMTLQRNAPNGGVWRGEEGFREMARTWLEAWDVFELSPEAPIRLGPDRFIVPTRQRAVAKGTDLELDARFFYTVEYRDGRWQNIGLFLEREGAERFLASGEA
jgi:ketosteroid isomerase-like protein